MQVTKLERSGYMLEYPTFFLVFNYTREEGSKLEKALSQGPDKAVVFLVTHNHRSAFDSDIFNLAQNHRRVYVLSNDISGQEVPDTAPVAWMSGGDSIENVADKDIRIEAYKDGDKGVAYYVTTPDSTVFYGGALGTDKTRQQTDVLIERIASSHNKVGLAMVNENIADSFAAKIATARLLTYE